MAEQTGRGLLRRRSRNGRRTGFGARFLCLALLACGLPAAQATVSLAEVTEVAEAGAGRLALRLLEAGQPAATAAGGEWQRWERQRIRVLRSLGDWAGVERRLAEPPAAVSAAFRRWAREQRVDALLELARPAAARRELARLIWAREGGRPAAEDLGRWRWLVIRTYQAEGRRGDAYAALLRYRQDYGTGDGEQALLQARVLLANGLPADAAMALDGVAGPEARVLRQMARLRAGSAEAHAVLPVVRDLAGRAGLAPAQRRLAWAAVAEAAAQAREPAARVVALERLLQGPEPGGDDLIAAGPAELWQAYLEYGERIGNQARLLLGDDAAWFDLAEAAGDDRPLRRRAVLALLARKAGTAEARQRAATALVRDLLSREWGQATARRLFLEAPTGQGPVPDPLLRALVDEAIAAGDLTRASRLQARVQAPPQGEDRVRGYLRRAKIFILGGRPDAGAATMRHLLQAVPALTAAQTDRLTQLVFDLQTLEAHDAALGLFEALLAREERGKVRRELYYWMADSRSAQGRHPEAARLYLRSAMLPGAQTMDPWAQSARYQASKALTAAGLTEDAAVLLRRLLAATDEPARKAVIRRDLQQLNLERHKGGTPDGPKRE